MVTYRGYRTSVLYDEETSYGAGATPATALKGKISTVTIEKSNNMIRTLGLGEGRKETAALFGNFEGTWSMEYELGAFDFLQFGIGYMDGSGTTVAPYFLGESEFMDYTAGASSGQKSFGLYVGSNDAAGGTHDREEIKGAIINTIGLSLNVGETLKCSLEGFYKTVTSSTTTTAATSDTTKPWIFAQGEFKWNATAVARVTSATVNINNNFDPEVGRQLGSRTVEAAEPGLRKYDWTLTVKMTDTIATTLRDHFYGQANSPSDGVASAEPDFYAVIFNFSEGSTSGLRNAQILLSDCSINSISKPIQIGENIVELTINGQAKRGTTDTVNKPIKWWEVP